MPYYYYQTVAVAAPCKVCNSNPPPQLDWTMTVSPATKYNGTVASMSNPYTVPVALTNNSSNDIYVHLFFGEFRKDPNDSDDHPTERGVNGRDVDGTMKVYRRVRPPAVQTVTTGYLVKAKSSRPVNDLYIDGGDAQLQNAGQVIVTVTGSSTSAGEKNCITGQSVNKYPLP